MSFVAIKVESEAMLSNLKTCRLCLSEESLSDVLDGEGLQQWIRDYLSITISPEDRISQNVCTICQIRLSEFHQFRTRCHEVQTVLQSMIQSKNAESGKELSNEVDYDAELVRIVDLESRYDHESSSEKHQPETSNRHDYEEAVNGQQVYLDTTIHVGEIKIEASDSEQSLTDYNSEAQLTDGFDKVLSVECEICHKKWQSRKHLNYHIKKIHEKKKYECSLCEVGFAYRSSLNTHLQSIGHINKQKGIAVDKPFKCDECGNSFQHEYSLRRHKKQTHGAKPLCCPVCGYKCSERWTLAQHIRRHDEKLEKMTKNLEARTCDICQKVFNSEPACATHKQEMHGAKNVGSYECDMCKKAFKRLRTLNFHKTDVHGPNNFVCPICSLSFTARYRLDRHMSVHDNPRQAHLFALHQKKHNEASFSSNGQDKAEADIKTNPDLDCTSATCQQLGQDTAVLL